MEAFLSVVIFTIPGILVYFWIQTLGLNPVVKHTPTELAAVVVLFWIPTVILVVLTYDLLYVTCDFLLRKLSIDISSWNMRLIKTMNDIQESSTNIIFLIIFFVMSLIFSFVVARIWIKIYDKYLLPYINKIRVNRKLVKLSETTSVWDEFFNKLKNPQEEGLVVEIYKIDKPEEKVVGSVVKMSRTYEPERSLVLDYSEEWNESVKDLTFKKERTYVDTKSGVVVTELNATDYKSKTTISLD